MTMGNSRFAAAGRHEFQPPEEMLIASRRLNMRPLKPSDVSSNFIRWLNDPDVFRYLETRWSAQNKETILAFVSTVNARDNEHLFGIFLKDGGRHIGNIKVGPINAHHRVGDVSLLIGERDCWGKGYATEAIAAVSRHAFLELNVRKLSAGMYAENLGSYKSFLRVGYSEEGRKRAHCILDGEPTDVIQVGLLAECYLRTNV
jgi:[ribosomal protein S5]-alanine N-acetyltransferase